MMEIYKAKMPKLEYSYSVESEFDDLKKEDLVKEGVDIAIYWYARGVPDGSGRLLFRKCGKWFLHDCGHCSCYGPTDYLNNTVLVGDKISNVKNKVSEGLWVEVEPLIILANEKGII